MPVDVKDVKVGHCYAADGERRRVTALVNEYVQFDTWTGDTPSTTPQGGSVRLSVEEFVRTVQCEIPCPDPHPLTPSQAEG